jgi:hypothetical protein
MVKMRVFKNKENTVYEFNKKLVVIKEHSRVKFYFPKNGLIKGLKGLCNIRFCIYPHHAWQYFHWLIRFPGFYWEKNNGGFSIGCNSLFLWSIR